MAEKKRVLLGCIVQGGDVLAWNDQDVGGRLRMDVSEGNAMLVLMDHGGGNLAIADAAKETVAHAQGGYYNLISTCAFFLSSSSQSWVCFSISSLKSWLRSCSFTSSNARTSSFLAETTWNTCNP